MKYDIHTLKLFEKIVCGINNDNGNGRLVMCSSSVTKKNMNPKPEEYITIEDNKDNADTIPAGNYFFVQGFLPANKEPFTQAGVSVKKQSFRPAEEIFYAAQSLWLEVIWQEKTPADNKIYMRLLHEDTQNSAGTVFQLFRACRT